MPTFNNGEANSSVRGKINNAITRAERVMIVDDVTQLANLVYTTGSAFTVAAGTQVVTAKEGFTYEVLASDASSQDIQPGAVKLNLQPGPDGFYNFMGMLPAANGTTDDKPKLQRLLDRVKVAGPNPLYSRGPNVYFPTANYFMGSAIDLKSQVQFRGDASGYFTDRTAQLTFPENSHGIVINRENTLSTFSASGIETTATGAADYSTISGLVIASLGGTDRTKHGVWARARFKMHSCLVAGFPGNGGNIVAGTDRTDVGFGNANCFYLEACSFQSNKNHGLYVDGIDANAGVIMACDASINGRMGFYDSSFLGNAYYGCHAASNGLRNKGGNGDDQACVVAFGGGRYAAHWTATEAQLVATTPGTDSNVWFPFGGGDATDNYPNWVSGKPEGTYFRAFGYFSDSVIASNYYFNCYNEIDAPSALIGRAVHIGAMMDALLTGAYLSSNAAGDLQIERMAAFRGNYNTILNDESGWMAFANSNMTGVWRLQESGGRLIMQNANLGARLAFYLTTESDVIPFSFGAERIALGSPSDNRQIEFASAPPTSGTWRRGDKLININPSAGGWDGWRCVASGTPGTWKGYGAIEP